MRDADAYTIKHEPIKSIDLMERAAGACYDWIYERAPKLFPKHFTGEGEWEFKVFCGVGNNGGDGLVIARMLMRSGYNVEVIVVHFADKESKDFSTNFDKLGAAAKKKVVHVRKEGDLPEVSHDCLVIDALFGSGLNRPAEGVAAAAIAQINRCGALVVSIDLPSGLFADGDYEGDSLPAVHAHHVLTFQSPKLVFFLAEYAAFVGEVHILDIGLHRDFLEKVKVAYHLVTAADARAMRQPRARYSHKGTYGHALLVGGSRGKWGSIAMTARACVKAGAGLVTVHTNREGATLLGYHVPEAMASHDPDPDALTELPDLSPYQVIAAGPGMGTAKEAARALKKLIQEAGKPVVLDADALNILAEEKTWMSFLPKGSVLTPHPGEFARLAGEKFSHKAAMEKQREMSEKLGIYILLKGAHSSLSTPEGDVFINTTGNAGMASGGTGDVLTGIVTGLLASGYSGLHAAALGMFIHGKAGDDALEFTSMESLSATDLIDGLGAAFNDLGYAE